ncbi:MAG TPA: CbbQ/NirQ/NorQ/GpvN family protein [Actinomycetes bacterium]|nr:CbbQ/NirQ/NorQ/GpvN family protein [Actinomycetes bacterium]
MTATVGETVPTRPYYLPLGDEVETFESAYAQRTPVMLKGPTGTGKTRFLEHMAWRLGAADGSPLTLSTVTCHEDLTAADLVGRFILEADGTHWVDGPLTATVRGGGICYLDEVVEARKDVMVVVHSLTDHRRFLPIARLHTTVTAHPSFLLVISYNPGYQTSLKELKHSTRQRFVAIEFGYPSPEAEAEILVNETAVDQVTADRLAGMAVALRRLGEDQLVEGPSTRLFIYAARLIEKGVPARRACEAAVAAVVTDDPVVRQAVTDVIAAHVPEAGDDSSLG